MAKQISVSLHIGGEKVERLTEEQCEKVSERMSEAMSRYFTANPSETNHLKNRSRKK